MAGQRHLPIYAIQVISLVYAIHVIAKRLKKHLAAAQSRWSELPEELIHHTFSFLPTREAARLSLLSKHWEYAWNSYLQGPSFAFIERESSSVKLEKFYKFMKDTMEKFTTQRPNTKIHKFELESTPLNDDDHITDAINTAIDNHVSEMTLLLKAYYPLDNIPKLVNNSCLTSLNLEFSADDSHEDLDWTEPINLPSLRSLTSPTVSIRTLERFLLGCPLLETVRCVGLTPDNGASESLLTAGNCSKLKYLDLEMVNLEAELFNEFLHKLGFLETLRISFKGIKSPDDYRTDSINLPKLQSLTLLTIISIRTVERFLKGCPLLETLRCVGFTPNNGAKGRLHIRNCSKLKYLDLEIRRLAAGLLISKLLSKLEFLETLRISFKRHDYRVEISNVSVRNIELHFWEWIKEVKINAPRLSCFRFKQHYFPSPEVGRLQISMTNATKICRANLTIPPFYSRNDLKKLMDLFGDLRTLSIFLGSKDRTMDQIEGFNLGIEVPSYLDSYVEALDEVLKICRPSILMIATSGGCISKPGKMFAYRQFNCHCSKNVEYCWKHQLKEVEIIDEEDKSRCKRSHVRFRLRW